jgi:hypothetical protein
LVLHFGLEFREVNYTIRKNEIRFFALGWNKYPNSYIDAKLINLFVVYDDKTSKEISLEKLR